MVSGQNFKLVPGQKSKVWNWLPYITVPFPKPQALAEQFHVPRVYDNAEELLQKEKLDFVEIITDVDTHALFTELAVKHGVKNIICQKPMAPHFEDGQKDGKHLQGGRSEFIYP